MSLSARRRIALLATLTLTVVLALVLGASAVIIRSAVPPVPPPGTLRIYHPAQSFPVPGPVRYLGRVMGYRPQHPSTIPCEPPPIAPTPVPLVAGHVSPHPDGVAFARHANPPGPLTAYYFSPPPVPPGQVAVVPLADLRYDVPGGTIRVVTCAPSPAAAQELLFLGNTEVALAPGLVGYIPNSGATPTLPYRVLFADGPLIIAVAGDSPTVDVVTFARGITISK